MDGQLLPASMADCGRPSDQVRPTCPATSAYAPKVERCDIVPIRRLALDNGVETRVLQAAEEGAVQRILETRRASPSRSREGHTRTPGEDRESSKGGDTPHAERKSGGSRAGSKASHLSSTGVSVFITPAGRLNEILLDAVISGNDGHLRVPGRQSIVWPRVQGAPIADTGQTWTCYPDVSAFCMSILDVSQLCRWNAHLMPRRILDLV